MDKQELQHLVSISEDIAFIERLEKIADNNDGDIDFMALPDRSRISLRNPRLNPIVLPKGLSKHILATLVCYKDSMQELMDNLSVVDKSLISEQPDDPYLNETEEELPSED